MVAGGNLDRLSFIVVDQNISEKKRKGKEEKREGERGREEEKRRKRLRQRSK